MGQIDILCYLIGHIEKNSIFSVIFLPKMHKLNQKWENIRKAKSRMFYKITVLYFYLLSLSEDMFIDFRERGREGKREGEKHQCEKETRISCLLHMPLTGDQAPDPGMCPAWLGIEASTFQFMGGCSNQLSHTGQVFIIF